jgi:hypothetical protein
VKWNLLSSTELFKTKMNNKVVAVEIQPGYSFFKTILHENKLADD